MIKFLKSSFWILILAMIFSVGAEARNYYGAISFSQSTGAYGYAYDYKSKRGAMNAARRKCGRRDCKTPLWFRNACGALAIGNGNGYGTGWGNTRSSAKRKALRSCRKYNRGCYIKKSVCTTR
ncbi:MAG: DUF4189 domain-containing protein [Sulfurovum sp.]